jgi:hypothetical protein
LRFPLPQCIFSLFGFWVSFRLIAELSPPIFVILFTSVKFFGRETMLNLFLNVNLLKFDEPIAHIISV